MKKLLITLFLVFNAVASFAAEKTWIKENYEGKIILTPEYIIEIPSYETYNTRLWLRLDNILILEEGYIINLDSREKVEIKNIQRRY